MDMQVEVPHADASPAEPIIFRYGWLYQLVQQWGRVELEQRMRFVTSLHQNRNVRMRLFRGGLQKLGPLPVLVPSYLQFLTGNGGAWAAACDLVGVLLIYVMATIYRMGWIPVAMHTRLDT